MLSGKPQCWKVPSIDRPSSASLSSLPEPYTRILSTEKRKNVHLECYAGEMRILMSGASSKKSRTETKVELVIWTARVASACTEDGCLQRIVMYAQYDYSERNILADLKDADRARTTVHPWR
ncbi:hypothetical protein N7G274_005348 [Stereocaulon virgatum]|uniref:Uncharacterized protein n=1 Tax=Stereocaulon virgatum TaxID=373712 RepID=A0ABR4A9N7_9LECA